MNRILLYATVAYLTSQLQPRVRGWRETVNVFIVPDFGIAPFCEEGICRFVKPSRKVLFPHRISAGMFMQGVIQFDPHTASFSFSLYLVEQVYIEMLALK
jgi:hypothetical protein